MLNIKNLNFAFGDHVIYHDMSLGFESGKITGVLGENGVGKTTLFRIMSKIYNPKSGSLVYNDSTLEKGDLSFLPTDPYFYPYMNGREYLKLVLPVQHRKRHNILNPFDLPLDDLVETYSTGMKKKLAFMGVLSQERDILILDEPFNGVDLQSNELLKLMIQKIKVKKTIIVSSHIISTLTDICDSIYYIGKDQFCQKYNRDQFHQIYEMINMKSEEKLKRFDIYK